MKDKEKQIEEMAKIIDDRLIEANCWLGTMYKGIGRWIAQKLVEHYQLKLPKDTGTVSMEEYEMLANKYKDSVVLSREEYEMLANQYKNLEIKYSNLCDNYRLCKDANKTLKQNVIVTRKETAKKILNDLVKNCQYTFNIDGKPIVELDGDFVLNAAKSYGVKMKE